MEPTYHWQTGPQTHQPNHSPGCPSASTGNWSAAAVVQPVLCARNLDRDAARGGVVVQCLGVVGARDDGAPMEPPTAQR